MTIEAGSPDARRNGGEVPLARMNREGAAYVFQCSGADGDWLALRGPLLLDADLVVECAAGLMKGVPGCWEVSVWVGDERVLTLLRNCDDPLPRTAH